MLSADQLRSFADSVPTLVWSAADGAAESFNQRWLDYTGLSASESLGGSWKAAIHPDDLPRLLDTFQRARQSCQPFEFEARLRRFDGEFRRFLMRCEPSQVPWGLEALNGAVTDPAWKTKPSWSLVSTEDRMIPPDAQRAMSKRAGSTVVEAKGSHAVYVSQPRAVADLIAKAANGVALATK